MKEKPSPSFARHLAAIEAGTITRTNVIGIRKLLNGAARRAAGWSVGATTPLGTLEQADAILAALDKYRPRVAGELHEGGLKVLRNRRYAKRLEPFAASIAALDHFRLVGFEDISRRGDGLYNVPVYAAWSTIPPKGDALDGGTHEAFRFRNVPWQSGGDGPEIVE